MQTTFKAKMSSPSMAMVRAPRSTRLACRCQLVAPRKASANPSSSAAVEQATLALVASMLPLATVLPASADDVVSPAIDAATDAVAPAVDAATNAVNDAAAAASSAAPSIFNMSPTDLGIAFSPLIVYGLFSLYRAKINPRAKITDLFFIIAAFVVFGNIFSILVFKKRIY